MTVILASRPNVYSSSPLGGIAERREEAAWIVEKLADPGTVFVPVWRTPTSVRGRAGGEPEAADISDEMAGTLRIRKARTARRGLSSASSTPAVVATNISAIGDRVPLLPEELVAFVDLRSVGWGVPRPAASVLAHARGWCTGATPQEPSVTASVSPHRRAAISLLQGGDGALLGHSSRFPRATMYTPLADLRDFGLGRRRTSVVPNGSSQLQAVRHWPPATSNITATGGRAL